MKNGSYELVKAPPDYPGKRYRDKYVYEHHLVWWINTGSLVPEGFDVHHKNEEKRDNRFENLELKKHAEHSREHGYERHHGYTKLKCVFCSTEFETSLRIFNYKIKKNQQNFFCSQECQRIHWGQSSRKMSL